MSIRDQNRVFQPDPALKYTEEKAKRTGAKSPIQQRWKLLTNVIIDS